MIKNVFILAFLFVICNFSTAQTISGVIFEDNNANGINDAEPGLSGVTYNIYFDSNGSGGYDAGVDAVEVMNGLTTGAGTYSDVMTNGDGTYFVQFSPAGPYIYSDMNTNGNVNDSDADPLNSGLITVVIAGGADDLDVNAGVFLVGQIQGMVFEDINGDGSSAGDGALPFGVDIALVDMDTGLPVNDAITNAPIQQFGVTGAYTFIDVPPGDNYQVTFTRPAGLYFTTPNVNGAVGTGDTDDSDATYTGGTGTSDGISHTFDIVSGQVDEMVDAGYYQPCEINGFIFEDINADGDNTGDPALGPNVTFILWDVTNNVQANDAFGTPVGDNTTGNYTFTDVPPGMYEMRFTTPTGPQHYLTRPNESGAVGTGATDDSDAVPNDGVGFGSSDDGTSHQFDLVSGQTDEEIDAGYFVPGIVEGFVWEDLNADGIQDGGEAAIADPVTITLIDIATGATAIDVIGGGGAFVANILGGDPYYEFLDVVPGNYRVDFGPVAGAEQYYLTTPDATGAAGDAADDGVTTDSDAVPIGDLTTVGQSHEFEIISNENPDEDIDCGYFRAAEINGYTWHDENGDGLQDATEPPLGGVSVLLLDDLGGPVNDVLGNPINAIVSAAADFSYTILDLRPGDYLIRFTEPGGFYLTTDDANGNATDAADDADMADSDAVATNVPETMGDSHVFNLESFETDEEVDAGFFQTCTIEGFVFEDKCGEGEETGDPGLDNVKVDLIDVATGAIVNDINGNQVTFTTTGAGTYLFTDVKPGNYLVRFTSANGSVITNPDYSGGNTEATDATDDSDAAGAPNSMTGDSHTFIAKSNEMKMDIDAGFYFFSTVGSLVWLDDDDGVYVVGEGLIQGVVIDLIYDANFDGVPETVVATAVTDAMGEYEFTMLPPGFYTVQVTAANFAFMAVLDGYQPSTNNGSPNDGIDDDNNGIFAGAAVETKPELKLISRGNVTGADLEENLTVDFGFFLPPCDPNSSTSGEASFPSCDGSEPFPICNLQDLNSFCSIMPDNNAQGPNPLCPNGGVPHNLDWFSFVAGSTTIELEVVPALCTSVGGNAAGLQAGIYDDCTFSNAIVCEPGCQIGAFSLMSTNFIEGQQYYFFLDGCNGSVCEYEINVIQGGQPFELPEMNDLTCPLPDCNIASQPVDICLGATDILFTIDGIDLDVNYFWTIDPAPAEYPGGEHPDNPIFDTGNNTFTASWNFNEVGLYTISVYADNGCDVNIPIEIQINVQPLPPEVFMDQFVCEGDLDNGYLGPQTEDPNGDGDIGWQGPPITGIGAVGPDLYTTIATNSLGCEYEQQLTVTELYNPLPFDLDTAFCVVDFVNIEGTIIADGSPQPTQILLDAANGCDSTIFVYYTTINVEGSLAVSECDNGFLNITFNTDFGIDTSIYDQIEYIWTNIDDPSSTYVADFDDIGQNLVIDRSGEYTLEINVTHDGVLCIFGLYTVNINFESYAAPAVTVVGDWDTSLCEDEYTQTYSIMEVIGEIYQWSYPADVTVVSETNAELILDWTGSAGGEVCVNAINDCGNGPQECETIEIVVTPVGSIAPITTACIDGITTVESDGPMDPNFTYTWTFDGGSVSNAPPQDINGPGPFDVAWPTSGVKTVTLVVTDRGCDSEPVTATVEIVDQIAAPQLLCASTSTEITLSWPSVAGALGYEVTYEYPVGNVVVLNLSDTELMVNINGLLNGTSIAFSVVTVSDNACGNSVAATTTCITQNCVQPTIVFTPNFIDICLDGDTMPFDLTPPTNSDPNVDVADYGEYVGNGITDATLGTFNPSLAGIGAHVISYTYYEPAEDCQTTAIFTVNVFAVPSAEFDLSADLICITETVTMTYSGGSAPETFTPDFGDATAIGSDGIYTLSWTTPGVKTVSLIVERDGCVSEEVVKMITVDPAVDAPVIVCEETTSTTILFEWQDIDNITGYDIILNGMALGLQDTSSFFIDGLSPGDVQDIVVTAISTNACPTTNDMQVCTAENCVNSTVMFNISDTTICITQTDIIDIDAILEIPTTDGTETWSGTGVDPVTGEFDPVAAGIGSWDIDYEYAEAGCMYPGSVNITVIAAPVASFDAMMSICETDALTVTYTGDTGAGYAYTWDFDGATVLSGSDAGPYELMWPSDGDYVISVMANNGVCDGDEFTQMVTADPAIPDPNISCAPDLTEIVYTWDSNPCASMYNIFVNDVLVSTQPNTTFTVAGLVEGTTVDFSIEIISICSCPGDTYELECTASPCPDIMLDLTNNDDSYCITDIEGTVILLADVTGSAGTGSGVWSGNGISPDGNWDASGQPANTYDFTYTFTEDGCPFFGQTSITIFDEPSADVIVTNPPCPELGATGSIFIDPSGGSGNYTFVLDNGAEVTTTTIDNIAGGDHELVVTDDQGCQVVVFFQIDLAAEISLALQGDALLTSGEASQIAVATNVDPVSIDSIVWTLDGVAIDCTSADCFTLDFIADTEQLFCATIYYNGSCEISDCLLISVQPDIPKVYIPTAFSPNNDGINDNFNIGASDEFILIKSMSIYDRWGERLYFAENIAPNSPDLGWDGRFKGEMVLPGVYVYVLDVQTQILDSEIYAGDITVIR